ncbi:MAG: GNAT family protein [Acidimicrobiia bacterium]|nr:GNAT family protein [Acidimicrobiia bacterium]
MPQLDSGPRHTPRFTLRPFRRRDTAAVYDAVKESLPELRKWLPWAAGNYTRPTAQHYVRDSISAWNEGRAWDFAIRRPEDPGRHVGNVSIWFTSTPNLVGEIGYWVRTSETGRSVCTEATARALQIAFEELRLHRVALRIAVGNLGSERVAEKLGFRFEGTLREEVKVGHEWLDHTVWGLLEREWWVERERYREQAWA